MGEKRRSHKILVGKLEGRQLWRPGVKQEDINLLNWILEEQVVSISTVFILS
jgi:hypothetical protein